MIVFMSRAPKLNDIDEMCVENVAEYCLNVDEFVSSGCDIEEHKALVNQLRDQKAIIDEKSKQIGNYEN